MAKRSTRPRRRKFKVVFSLEVEIEVDDDVVDDALSSSFKEFHYDFKDASDVAEHLAFNLVRGSRLSNLDGFAHWKDDKATMSSDDWERTIVEEAT
jgi:hypothetical protein